MLLRAGANVNALLSNKGTLLHEAISDYKRMGWQLPLLLAHGASTDSENDRGQTPLQLAINYHCIGGARALLESGVDVHMSHTGSQPLVMALREGNLELISTMLEHGADVHSKIFAGPRIRWTFALFIAVLMGHSRIVRLLVEEYSADEDATKVDRMGRGLLHHLACSLPGTLDDIVDILFGLKLVVNAEDNNGNTPLHDAARMGNIGVVKKLLEHGATPHAQNHRGKTPLDLAKAEGYGEVDLVKAERYREIIECLGGTYRKNWWRVKSTFAPSWV
ncbi:ankyrin repeat-containing domain protein [Paraphoma chrysanthemicola]|uniref:Ankyrin repeat-containing domain protein n=1 Tax=Paraphoma chrysanthemicola TaxID=798071 RepID=A0A8K0QSF5_9PLEO|nr:ankyrin repeat-containing domain protein [Paraphoma chrysanthemicola]